MSGLTEDEFRARLVEVAFEESRSPETWWWLSFVDVEAEPDRFLGVAIVRAHGIVGAVMEARRLEINPGGEVQGVALPADAVPTGEWRERLLSREETDEVNAAMEVKQT